MSVFNVYNVKTSVAFEHSLLRRYVIYLYIYISIYMYYIHIIYIYVYAMYIYLVYILYIYIYKQKWAGSENFDMCLWITFAK